MASKFYEQLSHEGKVLVDQAYAQCAEILKENESQLKAVADFLLEHETMTGAQFRAVMEGTEIPAEKSNTAFFD